MPSQLLEVQGVSKRFGAEVALNDVSLAVGQGEVVGLAGPNGAGKSTLMRIICRLVRPTAGNVLLDGAGLDSDPDSYNQHLGALIDAPGLYPYMTARQHLDFVAGIRGPVAAHGSADLLRSLGLDPESRKIAKHFSLGMRQRLAIAMTMVHSPRLLILDEPMNGLDPLGMKDLREAILSLARQRGVAILISSHLLAEIEQVCERVAILNHGTLISNTSLAQPEASEYARMLLNTTANDAALSVLTEAGFAVTKSDEGLHCSLPRTDIEALAPILVAHGVGLLELREARQSLESQFLTTLNAQVSGEA
jgi:ABC-2 type transport system ATP-binding protein